MLAKLVQLAACRLLGSHVWWEANRGRTLARWYCARCPAERTVPLRNA